MLRRWLPFGLFRRRPRSRKLRRGPSRALDRLPMKGSLFSSKSNRADKHHEAEKHDGHTDQEHIPRDMNAPNRQDEPDEEDAWQHRYQKDGRGTAHWTAHDWDGRLRGSNGGCDQT